MNKTFNNFNIFIFSTYLIWILYLYLIYFFSNYIKGGNFREGYKLGNDSIRYIEAGRDILKFNLPEGKALSYLSYDLIVAFGLFFNQNLFNVVLIQIFLTAISAYCLYKLTSIIFTQTTGIICFLIFLFYPDIQIRNFYILTESIIISIPIISFFLICNKNKYVFLLGMLLFLFACFIRPHAIVIFPLIIFIIYFKLQKLDNKFFIKLFYLILLFFIPLLIYLINYLLTKEGILNTLISGEIIKEYQDLKINNPSELVYLNKSESLFDIILIFYEYPIFFIKVFLTKFYWFFGRIRPYYSDIHNLIIIFTTVPLYLFFIIGIFLSTKAIKLKFILLLYIFLTTISVCLTTVDWSGRFILPIIPFICIFASAGIIYLYRTYLKANKFF